MTLRTKLTAILGSVIAVAALMLSGFAVISVESALVDQVDDGLLNVLGKNVTGPLAGPNDGPRGPQPPRPTPDPVGYSRYAELLIGPIGVIITAQQSGFTDSPDQLPQLDLSDVQAIVGDPQTFSTPDGGDVRAVAAELRDGRYLVIAERLDEAQSVAARTRWLAIASSLAVVAVAASATWFIIRRELRPVDRMIDSASAIASGDLTSRIEHGKPTTELGRLANALDDMASQLDTAFEQQQRSEARVRDFAADASHELRTPLAAIIGYAELYRQGGIPAGEPVDRAVAKIESEGKRMQRLVEDLLLMARLDRNDPLEVGDVALASLLTDTVENCRATNPDRALALEVDQPVTVQGDRRRLRQVFDNLVTNAVQHTPADTPVTVRLTASDEHAVVDITDRGPGIDPAVRERVFDRFFKGDRARPDDASSGGAGLGLAIVDGIVRTHRGSVDIVDHDGPGTTFRVTLPL